MSYFRSNGRFGGRVGGPGGRAFFELHGRYGVGDDALDILSLGAGGQIKGDPVQALIAQLNRFANTPIKPSSSAAARYYVRDSYPLTTPINDKVATAAVMIAHDRYAYAPIGTYSAAPVQRMIDALAGNTVAFVTSNLEEMTVTIAEFGDRMGLPPAPVGITEKTKPFAAGAKDFAPLAVAGGLLLVALLVTRKPRKR